MRLKELLKADGVYLIHRAGHDHKDSVAVIDGEAYPMKEDGFDQTTAEHVDWLRRQGTAAFGPLLEMQLEVIEQIPLPLPEDKP